MRSHDEVLEYIKDGLARFLKNRNSDLPVELLPQAERKLIEEDRMQAETAFLSGAMITLQAIYGTDENLTDRIPAHWVIYSFAGRSILDK